jgi:hypothetical protein
MAVHIPRSGSIGHEEDATFTTADDGVEDGHQLVHQGPVVPIGEHPPLVDPGHEWDGGNVARDAPHQQGHGLEAMAHDVFGLRMAAGFLMEGLDPRHLPPFLGGLDAIGDDLCR